MTTSASKTSFNVPNVLHTRFKVACIHRGVQMQDMVSAFMGVFARSVEHGLEVPGPAQLVSAEFRQTGNIIMFPAPQQEKETEYVAILNQLLNEGGPKAEAVKAMLVALSAEEPRKKKRNPA